MNNHSIVLRIGLTSLTLLICTLCLSLSVSGQSIVWKPVDTINGVTGSVPVWKVVCRDSANCVAAANIPWEKNAGAVFKTEDGGRTWERFYMDPFPELWNQRGVQFNTMTWSGETMVVTTDSGYLYVSRDDGESWERTKIGFEDMTQLQMYDESSGFAAGRGLQGNPLACRMYRTEDSWRTWDTLILQPPPEADTITSVLFSTVTGTASGRIVTAWQSYLLEQVILALSEDGGETWTYSTVSGLEEGSVITLALLDERDGWMVTNRHRSSTSQVLLPGAYTTSDGGRTWGHVLDTAFNFSVGGEFSIIRDADGVLIPSREGMLRTTDRGRTWRLEEIGAQMGFSALVGAWPKGSDGIIVSTIDNIVWMPERTSGIAWNLSGEGSVLQRVDVASRSEGDREIVVALELGRESAVEMRLCNLQGEVLWTETLRRGKGRSGKRFDASALPAGLYLLRVESVGETVTKKVILR